MYRAKRPQLWQVSVTCERGGGGIRVGDRSIEPEQEGQLRGVPFRSLAMRCRACAGLYVFGRGLRMSPPIVCRLGAGFAAPWYPGKLTYLAANSKREIPLPSGWPLRARSAGRLVTLVAGGVMGAAGMLACGPRAHIPPRPIAHGIAPAEAPAGDRAEAQAGAPTASNGSPLVPGAVPPGDSLSTLARALAPVLYLQRDERFPLSRVVAVVHPTRRLIAYNLLWRDDAHGAWLPFTTATDQEVVWIAYDSTRAPVEIWTYWHGRILHSPWPRSQVEIDVQWGKHGSLPGQVVQGDLPPFRTLNAFYALAILGLPDILLGRLNRSGPWCFCGGYRRYREFTRPVPLAGRLDAVVLAEDPHPALSSVFGARYSRKPPWPWTGRRGRTGWTGL